ncbi:daptide-type RiPP biosynthesis methyltransferase [Amycolatopsis azurea]|uniref:daptide-type RiPP biosynthesis methyltransferase n=1 Tax=Amycolatopsis azurea TaxID=36819 RepID=UPI003819E4AC
MISAPGTAGRLARLYGLQPQELYGLAGSAVYDAMCRYDSTELTDILRLVQATAGPVLELACGSGRLTFPLASRGHEVVALDNSAALLAMVKERLDGQRISVVEGDMAKFMFDRSFSLVVLGTSSVCLLDADQRASLFHRVADHLADDGVFYVSGLELDDRLTATARDAERVTVLVDRDKVLTLHQYFSGRRGVRTTSLFTETVISHETAARELFTSEIFLVSSVRLSEEVRAAGLEVVDTRHGPPAEQRHFQLTCRRAGGRRG